MNNRYARFNCRICGELVYSPIALDQNSNPFFLENKLTDQTKSQPTMELTCSGGHSDLYRMPEIKFVDFKPAGRVQFRRAMAMGL